MSDEKQLCECGCGNPADWEVYMEGPCYGAKISRACVGYHESSDVKWDATMDRIRSRRSTPAAKVELEELDFVAPRQFTLKVPSPPVFGYKPPPASFSAGERVCFVRTNCYSGAWLLCRGKEDFVPVCYCDPNHVPRIHAELCQLRDSAAPPAKTELEALRGLAEAFGSLAERLTCGECKATAPAYRFVHETRCAYCLLPASFGSSIDHLPLFHAPIPPLAPERAPWDWDADDVGYLP